MKSTRLFLMVSILVLTTVQLQAQWKDLFDGKTLAGWIQRGGNAGYEVKDGTIVGTSVKGTPNSFLCTDRDYANFVLELEFLPDKEMNSGIQIRSSSLKDFMDGRVHGYQVEIDPADRAWSGGIYDEGRRGWLYDLSKNEIGRKALKLGEWNQFHIEAIGSSIRTWLNGIPVSNLVDSMTPAGFIALQVHASANDALQVAWRKIRILDLGDVTEFPPLVITDPNLLTQREVEEGWMLLFDGKTGNGWRGANLDTFPEYGWKIQDGDLSVIESGGTEARHGGDIVTIEQYGDFELSFEFKLTEAANSGVKYMVTGTDPGRPGSAIGMEYQVLDDERHPDAREGIAGNRTLASFYDVLPASPAKKPKRIGEWNQGRIIVNGSHVEHWLNGTKVLEFERGSEAFRTAVAQSKFKTVQGFGENRQGHILIQDHGNRVSYRNIKLRKLTPGQTS